VSQLLQGGTRQGHTPALEAALEEAAVRCAGVAEMAAGDSSAHMCGLSTAATACLLELARSSGTGAAPLLCRPLFICISTCMTGGYHGYVVDVTYLLESMLLDSCCTCITLTDVLSWRSRYKRACTSVFQAIQGAFGVVGKVFL
jgi:hypothetical protein